MLKAFKRKAKQIRYPQGPFWQDMEMPNYHMLQGGGWMLHWYNYLGLHGLIRIFGGKTKRTTQVNGLLCFLFQSSSSIISIWSYYQEINNVYVASIDNEDTELLFPSIDN